MKRVSIIAIAAALAAGPVWISAASAQNSGAQQQQQRSSFSETDLKSYAEAAKEVQQINQEYMPQFQAADSTQKKQAVQEEATQKMVEAIKEKGLSVERYNQIASTARDDPETAAKINQYLR
jgi:uncharacterized protein HemX